MKVHLYATCWNEIRLLDYFLQHYQSFVERFVILDDGSTDGSIDFLNKQSKVTLISGNRERGSYIDQSRLFSNEAWKQSRDVADWILTCNIDELVYHRDIQGYLQRCKRDGITMLPAEGFEMVASRLPVEKGGLCDIVRMGTRSKACDKVMLFDPRAIEEIGFWHGRHALDPTGRVVYPQALELKMLHYKYLGIDYSVKRYSELKSRLLGADLEQGLGFQYLWDKRQILSSYASLVLGCRVVVSAGVVKDLGLTMAFLPLKLGSHLLMIVQKCRGNPVIRFLHVLAGRVRRSLLLLSADRIR